VIKIKKDKTFFQRLLTKKLAELLAYAVILAVMISMSYTLIEIFFHGFVIVDEPNRLILITEISLVSTGTVFVLYKMLENFKVGFVNAK
jgi:hypothetical protein